jgi:hypothetical protein
MHWRFSFPRAILHLSSNGAHVALAEASGEVVPSRNDHTKLRHSARERESELA